MVHPVLKFVFKNVYNICTVYRKKKYQRIYSFFVKSENSGQKKIIITFSLNNDACWS